MCSVFPALIGLAPGVRMLVAGGTGIVGSGVTLAALKQGAQVTVATRCYDRFEALKKTIPKRFHPVLSAVVGDLNTEKGVQRILHEATRQSGGVQHVVASLRGNTNWKETGHLVDQSVKDFQRVTNAEATAHFLLMRAFLPYLELQSGTTYTVVTGYPWNADWPPNPLQRVACGTVHGLVNGARAQCQNSRVAVNELRLKCQVEKQNDNDLVVLGHQRLGNDLVGGVLTAMAASGIRDQVVINSREGARKWAGSKYAYVTKTSTRIYPGSSAHATQ